MEHKKSKTLQFNQAQALSDEEIERMVKDAEANAEADKQRKEEADLKNDADQLVFMAEKTMKDLEGKVSEDEVKKVEEAKDALKSAIETGNLDDMRTKKEALEELVQQMTVKLYEQASAEAQAQEGPTEAGGQPTDDGVVDADFEEVEDDKKN